MTSDIESANRTCWLAKANQVARRVNFAWWLETLSLPSLIGATLGAATLLIARREFSPVPWEILAAAISGGILLLMLICWVWAARKFEQPEQSLVRIEASMNLHNVLSTARAGMIPWPTPPKKVDAGLAWHWPRLLAPPLGMLGIFATGLIIPIAVKNHQPDGSPEQPPAWRELNVELDHLTKEEVVDQEYLEETRKKLDELKSQEQEQWFSHSSLEATDSLKKSHRAEAERIEREVARAEKALFEIEQNSEVADQAQKTRMMEEFDRALENLQNGAMKLNPELLEQMKQLDFKKSTELTAEQIEQLRKNLKKNIEAMRNSEGDQNDKYGSNELLAEEPNGEDVGDPLRGPGHFPSTLGKEKDFLEIGKLSGLDAKDLSQSTPGDLLELSDGKHDSDRSASKVASGRSAGANGNGGDQVWRDSLNPDEQRTLKRYFE